MGFNSGFKELISHEAAKGLMSSLTFTFPSEQQTYDTVRGRRSHTFVKPILYVHLSVTRHYDMKWAWKSCGSFCVNTQSKYGCDKFK